jgi:hypothetical protein
MFSVGVYLFGAVRSNRKGLKSNWNRRKREFRYEKESEFDLESEVR